MEYRRLPNQFCFPAAYFHPLANCFAAGQQFFHPEDTRSSGRRKQSYSTLFGLICGLGTDFTGIGGK